MSIYGYCRISTAKQSIDRQIRNIKAEYPTAHIVQEAYTGTSIFRPEWLKLYRILRAGDVVVFDSVSRMSRNAEEGFALYEDLYCKGIRLFFFFNDTATTEIYTGEDTLSLHDALPIFLSEMDLTVFNKESIRSYRQRMRLSRPGHVWEALEDEDFLLKLGAVGIGSDGKKHPTSAGLLMFGNEYDIVRARGSS